LKKARNSRADDMSKILKLAVILLTFMPKALFGHPLDIGYLKVDVKGNQMSTKLELNPKAAQELVRSSGKRDLMAATLGKSSIRLNGQECQWSGYRTEQASDSQIRLSAEAKCPVAGDALEIRLPFLTHAQATFQLLGRIRIADSDRTVLMEPSRPDLRVTLTHASSLSRFIGMGIHHIGAAPGEWMGSNGFHFPDGIDHILFLFGLILGGGVGGGLWCTLRTATGFTLGHSITLALAALGWVRPPGRIIESAIALSIAYIALEVLILKKPKRRFQLAVFFGLIHGFGFASALEELQLRPMELLQALVGFNLGVELGQVLIILALLPLVLLMHSKPLLGRVGIPAFAAVIALVGSYWFIERAMGV
jgi:hypothetical protein